MLIGTDSSTTNIIFFLNLFHKPTSVSTGLTENIISFLRISYNHKDKTRITERGLRKKSFYTMYKIYVSVWDVTL